MVLFYPILKLVYASIIQLVATWIESFILLYLYHTGYILSQFINFVFSIWINNLSTHTLKVCGIGRLISVSSPSKMLILQFSFVRCYFTYLTWNFSYFINIQAPMRSVTTTDFVFRIKLCRYVNPTADWTLFETYINHCFFAEVHWQSNQKNLCQAKQPVKKRMNFKME